MAQGFDISSHGSAACELNPPQVPLSYGQFEVSRGGSRSAGVSSQDLMFSALTTMRQQMMEDERNYCREEARRREEREEAEQRRREVRLDTEMRHADQQWQDLMLMMQMAISHTSYKRSYNLN